MESIYGNSGRMDGVNIRTLNEDGQSTDNDTQGG